MKVPRLNVKSKPDKNTKNRILWLFFSISKYELSMTPINIKPLNVRGDVYNPVARPKNAPFHTPPVILAPNNSNPGVCVKNATFKSTEDKMLINIDNITPRKTDSFL